MAEGLLISEWQIKASGVWRVVYTLDREKKEKHRRRASSRAYSRALAASRTIPEGMKAREKIHPDAKAPWPFSMARMRGGGS